MHNHPNRRHADGGGERGSSLVEYALLLALIAVVCFAAVSLFGETNSGGFGRSRDCIDAAYRNEPLPAKCQ